jgi:membrane protease YdiL (CAAX protease family)
MKGRSILDAVIAFTVLQAVLILPQGVRDLVRWENRVLGGSYLTGLLLVAVPIFAIILRKYEFRLMGIVSEDWRKSINTGFRAWPLFLVPQLVLTFFYMWGIRYQDFTSHGVFLAGIVLVVIMLYNRGTYGSASDRRLIIIGVILLFPLAWNIAIVGFNRRIFTEFIWNIIVGGFAEEFFYRGYVQSSINQEYGCRWTIGKTQYGPGLIVSSLLYGVSRGIQVMKPWNSVYSFAWGWGIYAFSLGLFYGSIREKSGDIIGSGTANSMIDAIGVVMIRLMN